jgi:hypothetical protein
MQVINEKLVARKCYTDTLRGLKPDLEVLVVKYDERNTISTITSRLKRDEGFTFITQKDGDNLKIQKISIVVPDNL